MKNDSVPLQPPVLHIQLLGHSRAALLDRPIYQLVAGAAGESRLTFTQSG
jgi:hypothetical protein